MMVPTTMLIWVTPPARMLGPASHVRRRTPGVQRGRVRHAADGDRGGQPHAGGDRADLAGEIDHQQRGDEDDVEQRRRESGGGEAADAVQGAGKQRDDRDQEEIRKGDTAKQHREIELLRVGGKARRQPVGQPHHA